METFLSKKGSLDAERAVGVHGKGPSKPNARPSNLLFNPQPRPRQRIPWPTSTNNENAPGRERQQEGGGGYASSYSKLRVSRLTDQAPTAVSQIFAGLSFYFNGRSGDKQTMHLKGGVSRHGGRTTPFMSMKGVTHVIAENLSASKTDKAMKSLKMKVVHPDWITQCMAKGRLLPDAPFRVVRSQKLGMTNFFSSGDGNSEKENPRGGGKCAPAGTPAGGGEQGKGEGKIGGCLEGTRDGKVGSSEKRRRGVGGRREKGRAGLAAPSVAAAFASSSNRKAESAGGSEVGSGAVLDLSMAGDAGRSCRGGDSGSYNSGGDAGRGCSGRGSSSYSNSSRYSIGDAARNCSGKSSSCYRNSCKENGNAVGVLAGRGSPKSATRNPRGVTRQRSEVDQESGLRSGRSSHTSAAKKRPRHASASPTPLGYTLKKEWYDLSGDNDAIPSSPSNARKRQNNAHLDRRPATRSPR